MCRFVFSSDGAITIYNVGILDDICLSGVDDLIGWRVARQSYIVCIVSSLFEMAVNH